MKKLPPSKQQAFQSSPFKNTAQIQNNHQKNASKDLESYLRQSQEQKSQQQYNFKEVDQFESTDEQTASTKRQPRLKKQNEKKQKERSASSSARLHDLCPEDKAKIGELVKKLASETKQKQEHSQKYEQEKEQLMQRMKELEKKTMDYENEREKMKNKFTESLHMLKTMKEEHFKLEESKVKQDQELSQVKTELQRREVDLARQQEREEQEKSLRLQLDREPVREREVAKQYADNSQLSSTQNNDQAISTLREISDLKNEIMKLTSTLRSVQNSPEQSFKHKSRTSKDGNRSKSKDYLSSDENDEQAEQQWWETHSKGGNRQGKTCNNLKSNKEQHKQKRDNSTLLMSRVEDLKTMKVEDLHDLQEELTKKLEITNSLLYTKQPKSARKKDSELLSSRRSGSKLKTLDEGKMAKLIEKAATEYDDYFSSSPTPRPSKGAPEPTSLNKKEEILAKKMQMYKEIQQRVQPSNESIKLSPKQDDYERPERDTNPKDDRYIGSSYYKNLIQQQTQILQSQKQGKPPSGIPHMPPQNKQLFNMERVKEDPYLHTTSEHNYINTTSEQQHDDSDDDLIYSLNQRSKGVVDDRLQRSQHHHYQEQQHQQLQQQQQQDHGHHDPLQPHYDDSLLTIIDEIEQDQKLQESQQQESARYQPSNSKQPHSFFQQSLNQSQIQPDQLQYQRHIQPSMPTSQYHQQQYASQSNSQQQSLQLSYLRMPLPQQQQHQQPYQGLRQSQECNPINQSMSSQQNNSSYKSNPYYLKAKQEVDQFYQGPQDNNKLSRMMQGIRETEQIPPQQQQSQLLSELQKLNFNYDDKENLRNRQYDNQQQHQQQQQQQLNPYQMSLNNSRKQVTFNM